MNAGATVVRILNNITTIVAKITNGIATICSPSTAKTTTAIIEQGEELGELKIMQRMVFLKDLALAEEDWMPEHTQELNYLATILHNQHGWETEAIHNYVGQLVAAGPEGYEYDPNDQE